NVLAIELGHPHVLVGYLLRKLRVAGADLLLTRSLGDSQPIEVMLHFVSNDFLAQRHRVLEAVQRDRLAAGDDLMPALVVVPLGQRRRHMPLLDDLPPADACVISAERYLALLRRVRNNALFGPPEIVIEEILEPHAGNEEEIPPVTAPFLDVG